ncbi:MAG: hydroxysqualene dehydroxylase HpnE, partial [Pseudomonadota bacterium]|nr:hydroxysqualene dehydroxylase HpnE [Pseudomonadota bacterium]
MSGREVAVIGGGWAGLAAAIETTRQGAKVTLFEMAKQLGGRAREITIGAAALDNGQHICIGAYTETLRLLRELGVSESDAFVRMPLKFRYADRGGLELRDGPPLLAFTGAVLRHPHWNAWDKSTLLAAAARWMISGFRCDRRLTVSALTAALTQPIREELIEPLCVAALNTPADAASASVFLRVLGDALFSGRGSEDLLLPRISLGEMFPAPAARWLASAGATVVLGGRVVALTAHGEQWLIDEKRFDGVILAAPPAEAARLVRTISPSWADCVAALRYEPIVTVYLRSVGTVLPEPMLALHAAASLPAQFVFDRGRLGGEKGLLAFVISGARDWVDAGAIATLVATRRQAEAALGSLLKSKLETVQVVTEKRATFRCTPQLRRPPLRIAPRLCAAGDHVDGPYPSTLEGAVR